jgi:hypothetical protein
MARLRRFDHHRYIGLRDTMVVYDCDDDAQLAELEARVDGEALFDRNLIQSFAPDALAEARNRGFTPRP